MSDINKIKEENKAVEWLTSFVQYLAMRGFGGYYGAVYEYEDIIFIVDPGHESQKYNGLSGYKIKDIVNLYKKLNSEMKNNKCVFDEKIICCGEEYKEKLIKCELSEYCQKFDSIEPNDFDYMNIDICDQIFEEIKKIEINLKEIE